MLSFNLTTLSCRNTTICLVQSLAHNYNRLSLSTIHNLYSHTIYITVLSNYITELT